MRKLGRHEIEIATISNPEDFMPRVDEPRIASRAASIVDVGLLHEPWVRASDRKLIAGRDRMAAHVKLGRATVLVELVECNDEEASLVELEENFARRHDKEEQARLQIERVAKYAAYFASKPKEKPKEKRKHGQRGKSAIGLARDKVAGELDVKPETLRKREIRHRQRNLEKTKKAVDAGNLDAAAPKPTIKLLGMPVGDDFTKKVAAVGVYIDGAISKARGAKLTIGSLRSAELPVNDGLMQRLWDDLHDMEAALKAARPSSLCPFCKGLAGVQESCGGCVTTGYITEGQNHGVPAELWAEGHGATVMWQGKQALVSDLIETQVDEALASDDEGGLFGDMPE